MQNRWLFGSVVSLCSLLTLLPSCMGAPPATRPYAEYWIDRLGESYQRVPGEWGLNRPRESERQHAREALRRIGPDAASICIAALEASNNYQRRVGAADALRVFGEASRPALPLLIDIILDVRTEGETRTLGEVALQTIVLTRYGVVEARGVFAAALDRAASVDRAPDRDEIARLPDVQRRQLWVATDALLFIDPWNRDAVNTTIAGMRSGDRRIQHEAVRLLLFHLRQVAAWRLQHPEWPRPDPSGPLADTLVDAMVKVVERRPDDETSILVEMSLPLFGPTACKAIPALQTLAAKDPPGGPSRQPVIEFLQRVHPTAPGCTKQS